jgi:hypothetical protein
MIAEAIMEEGKRGDLGRHLDPELAKKVDGAMGNMEMKEELEAVGVPKGAVTVDVEAAVARAKAEAEAEVKVEAEVKAAAAPVVGDDSTPETVPALCPVCEIDFITEKNVARHLEKKHPDYLPE